MIAGVVLAAGGSSRFGEPKQLAELRGRTLLDRAIDSVRLVPAIGPVIVVLGAEAERIRARVDLDDVQVVIAADWSEGIAASLRAGVEAAGDADAVLITLADQPLITPQVIAAVVDRAADGRAAVRATYGGAPGHPVLIRRDLFEAVGELCGDAGARELLEAHGVATIECGHLASARDVDTPDDLRAIAG